MLTVRMPDGSARTYNDANFLEAWGSSGGMALRAKDGAGFVAIIQGSAGATVEAVSPCRIDPPAIPSPRDAARMLMAFLEGDEHIDYYGLGGDLVDLKRALANFHATKRTRK